ncbi:MAG TPA: F0F1 ATP synthase subunit delta [Gammaproteobacteria bacterium]|nr:F0F1 ATP synthase subunit delta [Gammaproteobacteria bacterium]
MAELTTLARPYAKAVFDLARDDDSLPAWSECLERLAAVVSNEEVQQVIESPRVPADQIVELVLEAAGAESMGDAGRNLVRLLAANRRLSLVPAMAGLYEEMRAEAEGTVDVEVVSAKPLTDEQQDKIERALAGRLGKKVRLHNRVDEEMLGGAVIHAGDVVIDGSVQAKLGRLASALVH